MEKQKAKTKEAEMRWGTCTAAEQNLRCGGQRRRDCGGGSGSGEGFPQGSKEKRGNCIWKVFRYLFPKFYLSSRVKYGRSGSFRV